MSEAKNYCQYLMFFPIFDPLPCAVVVSRIPWLNFRAIVSQNKYGVMKFNNRVRIKAAKWVKLIEAIC